MQRTEGEEVNEAEWALYWERKNAELELEKQLDIMVCSECGEALKVVSWDDKKFQPIDPYLECTADSNHRGSLAYYDYYTLEGHGKAVEIQRRKRDEQVSTPRDAL